jgi:hypothetical protein
LGKGKSLVTGLLSPWLIAIIIQSHCYPIVTSTIIAAEKL